MNKIRVSIIMSTYNNAQYIEKAVQSVLSQSYRYFEFIIINDNSSDNTDAIVAQINDERIVFIKNEKNEGLIANLNRGIAMSKGEYIARIDSDDWWIDVNKLKKQVEYLDMHRAYVLVGTSAKVFDRNAKELYQIIPPSTYKKIYDSMLSKNCFIHSSVVYRKSAVQQCGNYVDEEKYVEDYGLWLRIGKNYKFANIEECFIGYLHNEKGETQNNNLAQIRANLKLVHQHKYTYPHYFFARLRWYTKYMIVYLGGLSLIHSWKKRGLYI